MQTALPAETEASETRIIPLDAHLNYLDGLRGLAALYVVIYHACANAPLHRTDHGLKKALYHLSTIVSFGQAAVAVFIVLSGYCLMLPVVRANQEVWGGGADGANTQYVALGAFFLPIMPPWYLPCL